jgi:hypothetical protein
MFIAKSIAIAQQFLRAVSAIISFTLNWLPPLAPFLADLLLLAKT